MYLLKNVHTKIAPAIYAYLNESRKSIGTVIILINFFLTNGFLNSKAGNDFFFRGALYARIVYYYSTDGNNLKKKKKADSKETLLITFSLVMFIVLNTFVCSSGGRPLEMVGIHSPSTRLVKVVSRTLMSFDLVITERI